MVTHHSTIKLQSILAGLTVATIPSMATFVLIFALRADPHLALGLCFMALMMAVRYIGRRFCWGALLGSIVFAAYYLPPTGSLRIYASYQMMFVLFMGASLAICVDVRWFTPMFAAFGRILSFARPPQAPFSHNTEAFHGEKDRRGTRMADASALPRILFVDDPAALNSGEFALLNLLGSLDRERYVPIVVLLADGPLTPSLVEAGISAYILPFAPDVVKTRKHGLNIIGNDVVGRLRLKDVVATLICIGRLAQFIRRHRINIVHTMSPKSDIVGAGAARLARIPVLWHVQEYSETDCQPSPAVSTLRWLCGWIPDDMLTSSQVTPMALKTQGILKFKLNTLPAAILSRTHLRLFQQIVQDGMQQTLAALADQPDRKQPTRVGIVGRLTFWKGQHVFLCAAALVCERFPQTIFQIIGAARLEERAYEVELKALVAALGLSENVEFTGFRRDIPELIADLDILVHASTVDEPFAYGIVEGMAAGKPIVATNGVGVSEIVVDGVTGLLVPMGDTYAMANTICHLLANPPLAIEMGKRGFERVCENFMIEPTLYSVEMYSVEMYSVEQVYEQILQRPS